MSLHIGAAKGAIAETILLPGDPLRAKFIAENFLEDAVCYNKIRGMYGFTGIYRGQKISVQGTGMGIPSISIYVYELIREYEVRNLIRIGTCGTIQKDIGLRDIILAQCASTDSNVNKIRFKNLDFAPGASFELLYKAYNQALQAQLPVKVGGILSSDTFYEDNPIAWKLWARYGVLAIEMETAALYTLASQYKVKALSILTVSDNLLSKESASAEDREITLLEMINLALTTVS
ncbi:MAG TPA: purine-nucleoside phosphorylase [Desulfitobacteriaceae bacterium]|nr:purine-nucleoside phosphorylase [Desulfitobacteriaceae bacterium]